MDQNATRTLAGWSLIVAPLLLLIWNALDPAVSDDASQRLTQIADHKTRFVLAGYFAVLGAWAFVPAFAGLWHVFRGPRLTLGQIGAGLMLVGMTTTIAFFGFGVYEYEAAQPGYNQTQMAKLANAVEAPSAIAVPLLIVFLVGVVIGSFVVAASLWRRKLVPRWSPLAVVVGALLNLVADSPALGAVAYGFTLVGLGRVGLELLAMPEASLEPMLPCGSALD